MKKKKKKRKKKKKKIRNCKKNSKIICNSQEMTRNVITEFVLGFTLDI